MKNFLSLLILYAIISVGCQSVKSQQPAPNWAKDQLMEPADLAAALKSDKNVPVIVSVGPGAVIPGSVDAGASGESEGISGLEKALKNLPKNSNIVIYCGCCPFEHCPNVRPAIDVLKKEKFTNFHLLNLPHNINTDWISKGYPTKK